MQKKLFIEVAFLINIIRYYVIFKKILIIVFLNFYCVLYCRFYCISENISRNIPDSCSSKLQIFALDQQNVPCSSWNFQI